MPEDGKRIVNEKTIVATEQDSAPAQETPEVSMDTVENDASEMGHSLPLNDEVSPGQLDWSDMAPAEEFDRIASERGVGPQTQGEDGLTESMQKRISKMKQQEQQKLEGKDQTISELESVVAAREQQIGELQKMAQEYQNLQTSYVPPDGDVNEVDSQIAAMDQQLRGEGDTFTAAEVAQHMQKRQDLQTKKQTVAQSQAQAQQIVQQQKQMREQSDQFVRDNYNFVNDPKSEYYQTLKSKAYPMLESIIGPNFKNHPQDMVIAAELSQLMVDANKYQQLLGNRPAPRQEPAPMAGNVTPQSNPSQKRQPSFRQSANNLRGSGVDDFASLLQKRGHSWRP